MGSHGEKSYEYDKANSYIYDYSGIKPEQNISGYHKESKGVEGVEKQGTAEYYDNNEEFNLKNGERGISNEKCNEYDDYCVQCYKIKDIAGEKWEKSNELADCARKIGIQAKRAEEKADYYKKLALEECENANKLWDEYRCLSNESIELMREARKYMTKFEDCLRECEEDDHNCNPKCYEYKPYDCNSDNRCNQDPKQERLEYRPERQEYRPKKDSGYGYPRR